MNLYMSAYVSNEPFQTAVISGCLALAALMLFSERVGLRSWILLSIGLGLAILTKFTSLLIAPIIAFFVALRLWWVDGRSPGAAVHYLLSRIQSGEEAPLLLRHWLTHRIMLRRRWPPRAHGASQTFGAAAGDKAAVLQRVLWRYEADFLAVACEQ